ncbi:hypothetical protein F5X96DRAFT_635126 [Biscogniauxia mediterranea]|nr:hypothetical protein F5X96DRAFT_635126 [Biscogniauxia mediterranea]
MVFSQWSFFFSSFLPLSLWSSPTGDMRAPFSNQNPKGAKTYWQCITYLVSALFLSVKTPVHIFSLNFYASRR